MKKVLSLILSLMVVLSMTSAIVLADGYPTMETAREVTLGTHLERCYLYRNNQEYYKFNLTEQTNIKATVGTVPMFREFTLELLNAYDEVLTYRIGFEADTLEMTVALNPGTYYLKLTSAVDDNYFRTARMEPEELFYDFTLAEATDYAGVPDENEPNNYFNDATSLFFGMGQDGSNAISANLHDSLDVDYYYLGFEDPYHIDITATGNVMFEVYNDDYYPIATGYGSASLDVTPGSYYVKVVHEPEINADFFNMNYQIAVDAKAL